MRSSARRLTRVRATRRIHSTPRTSPVATPLNGAHLFIESPWLFGGDAADAIADEVGPGYLANEESGRPTPWAMFKQRVNSMHLSRLISFRVHELEKIGNYPQAHTFSVYTAGGSGPAIYTQVQNYPCRMQRTDPAAPAVITTYFINDNSGCSGGYAWRMDLVGPPPISFNPARRLSGDLLSERSAEVPFPPGETWAGVRRACAFAPSSLPLLLDVFDRFEPRCTIRALHGFELEPGHTLRIRRMPTIGPRHGVPLIGDGRERAPGLKAPSGSPAAARAG